MFSKDSKVSSGHSKILLLGEIGAGKTTWINACVSYLRYKSLQDALDVPADEDLAPSTFDILGQHVKYGSDSNEIHVPGSSTTQLPKTYNFNIGAGSHVSAAIYHWKPLSKNFREELICTV